MKLPTRSLAPIFFFLLFYFSSHAQQWQWAKVFSVSGRYGHVAADSKGNAYVMTYTAIGQGDLSGTVQVSSLRKFDSSGNIVFTNPIGGRQEYSQLGVDNEDHLLVGGFCRDSLNFIGASFNPTLTSYAAALNGDGSWLWNDLSSTHYPTSFSSNSSHDVVYLRGGYQVVCVNQSGSLQWASTFTFATNNSTYGGHVQDITVGKNDHIFVIGAWTGSVMTMNGVNYYLKAGGDGGGFLAELNSSGQLVQVSIYPGSNFSKIKTDGEQNLYLMGTLKLNQTVYIGGDSLTAVMSNSVNTRSYFITKLSDPAHCIWIKEIERLDPGYPYSWGYQMDISSGGDVFIAGYALSDFHVSSYSIPADSSIFVVALDKNANFLWTNGINSANNDLNVYGISAAGNGGVYVLIDFLDCVSVGNFKLVGGTELDDDPYVHYDHFALAMINNGSLTTGLSENPVSGVKIFPNPGKRNFKIAIHEEILKVRILDQSGSQISNFCFSGSDEIEIDSNKPGLYFIQVSTRSCTYTEKVIVE